MGADVFDADGVTKTTILQRLTLGSNGDGRCGRLNLYRISPTDHTDLILPYWLAGTQFSSTTGPNQRCHVGEHIAAELLFIDEVHPKHIGRQRRFFTDRNTDGDHGLEYPHPDRHIGLPDRLLVAA